jgi:hypothetical protein
MQRICDSHTEHSRKISQEYEVQRLTQVDNATYLETTLTNNIHDKMEEKNKFNKRLTSFTSEIGTISSIWNLKNLAVCYESDKKAVSGLQDRGICNRFPTPVRDIYSFVISKRAVGQNRPPNNSQGKLILSFKAT